MANKAPIKVPTDDEKKTLAAANLSTLSWLHALGDYKIFVSVPGNSSSIIEDCVEHLGVKLDGLRMLGGNKDEPVQIRISGKDNLTKLALAGVKFPGSDSVYSSPTKEWAKTV